MYDKIQTIASKLKDMCESYLLELNGKYDIYDDVEMYYYGMLRRQHQLLGDLSLILDNRRDMYISTPSILIRILLEDFLNLLYLDVSSNVENEIIKINAHGFNESFKMLSNVAKSKHQNYNNTDLQYLSEDEILT